MNKQLAILLILNLCFSTQCAIAQSESIPFPSITAYQASLPPDFPNSPHVQLLFTENGLDCPKELHYFFIDKAGMGYFKYLKSISKKDITSDWSCARKHGRTYSFWGIFHGERVENTREQYFIDLKFKRKMVKAYRIRGPHVLAPNWIELEAEEKKK